MAVYREQKKVKGTTGSTNIANVEDIKAKLPLKYQVNFNNLTYVCYNNILDRAQMCVVPVAGCPTMP